MKTYEYICLNFDFGDLKQMNNLSNEGWRVITVQRDNHYEFPFVALMEREVAQVWEEQLLIRRNDG